MADYAPGHIIIKTTLDTSGAVKQGESLGKELEKAIEKGSSSKIPSGIKEINKEANKAEKSVDKVEQELEQVETQSEKTGRAGKKAGADMGQSFDKASGQAKALMTAIKGVMLGYTGKKLTDFFIGSNADMEQYLASFDTMLGSTEKAEMLMANLQNMANKTPFDTVHLTSASQTLLAYGEKVENLQGDLEMLGDISQGSAEKLSSLALAFGQIQSTGRLTGQDLLQLINVGFNPLQTISEQTGKSMVDLKKEMEEGKISFDDVRNAMVAATSEGGLFFGAMEKQSQTLKGMLSTLSDEFAQFGRDAGSEAFAQLKDGFEELLAQLEQAKADGTLAEIAEDVGNAVAGTVKIIVTTTRFLIEHRDIIVALGSAYAGWKTAMIMGNTISSVVRGVKSIIDMVKALNLTRKINLGVLSATEIAEKSATISGTAAAAQKRVLAIATDKATGSQIAYNVALSANPIMLVVGALAALTAGLIAVSISASKTSKLTKELNESFNELNKSNHADLAKSESEIEIIERKMQRYDELRGKLTLTASESTELRSVAESLQNTFGDEIKVVDELTGKYNDLGVAFENYSDKIRNQAKEREFQNTLDWYDEQLVELENKLNSGDIVNKTGTVLKATAVKTLFGGPLGNKVIVDDFVKATTEIKAEMDRLSEEREKHIDDFINDTKTASEAGKNASQSLAGVVTRSADEIADSYSKTVSSITGLSSAVEEQNKYGEISYETYQKLIDSGYAVAASQDSQTGAIRLNINSLKDLTLAQVNAVKGQMELDTALLRSQANSLRYSSINSHTDYTNNIGKLRDIEKQIADIESNWQPQIQSLQRLSDSIKGGDFSGNYGKSYSGRSTTSSNKTSDLAKQHYNEEIAHQKWRLEIGIISEKDYYKKLAEARKKYLKQGTDEWRASYKESFNYIKSTADEQTQAILESMNKVVSARDSAMQKMVDNAKLYTKEAVTIPETTAEKGLWKITTHEHTKDGMNTDNSRLREALAQNATYEALRKKLIDKKANAYILETFDSLSVEDAILFASSVLSKSGSDWKEYNQLAGQVKSSSEARATRMYQSDVDDIKQGFVDKVNATFKGLTGDMALHGQSLVKSLVDGWNEEFKKSGFNSNITLSSAIKGGTLSTSPASAQLSAHQSSIAPEIKIEAVPLKLENTTTTQLVISGNKFAEQVVKSLYEYGEKNGIQFINKK